MEEIEISIIIPVKNGEKTLIKCLNGIFRQTLIHQTEVIAIDSGSTDNSIEILNQYPLKLIKINPKDFNHGGTRNLGVKNAKGKYVVMTVQDAIPTNNQWLQNLTRHFNDPMVVAVCGQQIVPHDKDKNPHEWFRPINPPIIKSISFENPQQFLLLTPFQQREFCSLDDVCAAYRKEIIIKIPFQNVAFGEDMAWAKKVLLKGFRLIFDNNSQVYHYHNYNREQAYKRFINEMYFNYRNFNIIPKANLTLKYLLIIIYRNIKYEAHPKWILYNYMLSMSKLLASKKIATKIKINETALDNYYQNLFSSIPIAD